MKNTLITTLAMLCIAGGIHAKPITLQAVSDFPTIGKGEAPFYKDTRTRALAINAANRSLRDKWADAEVKFSGNSGKFDITITTLAEIDGESTYRLLVNGQEAGSFQNPETKKDYACTKHTWSGIALKTGDKITISAKAHTNGKIPERGGTAWARGRWRSLELASASE